MPKYEHPQDETVKEINDVFLSLIPERYGVRFNVLVDNNQKEVFKLKKLGADMKFAYGDDFQITVPENMKQKQVN